MEPLGPHDTPSSSACGRHGSWEPAVISCKHIWTGRADPRRVQLHHANRRIACSQCFDDWDALRFYCPACLLQKLKKLYWGIAKRVEEEKWFGKKP